MKLKEVDDMNSASLSSVVANVIEKETPVIKLESN
jgi:hypothetical protein